MKKIVLPILVLGLMMVAMPSLAATWYIDADSGVDSSECGDITDACVSFSHVQSGMSGGDDVYFKGTFTEEITIETSAYSGTSEDYTLLSSWPGEEMAIINTASETGISIDNAEYIALENLAVTGNTSTAVNLNEDANNIRVRGLAVHDNTGVGIMVRGENIGVVNCFVFNNEDGISVNSAETVMIANNTFYGNTTAGLSLTVATSVNLLNNIFSSNVYGVSLDSDTTGEITSNYNDYYSNTSSSFYIDNNSTEYTLTEWQDESNQDSNSLEVDPVFTSTTSGSENLHLAATSGVIDVASDEANVEIDFDQEARPMGDGYDMGADEYFVLTAPTNLSSTASVLKINIAWDEVLNATSYNIKYGRGVALNAGVIVDLTSSTNSKEVTDLKNAGRYYWKVQAVYTNGDTEVTSDWSETKRTVTNPRKVRKDKFFIPVEHRAAHEARIRIKSMVKRINGFNIIIAEKTTDGYEKVKTVKVSNKYKRDYTIKTITGLKSETKYRIRIKARRKIGTKKFLSQTTVSKYFTTTVDTTN